MNILEKKSSYHNMSLVIDFDRSTLYHAATVWVIFRCVRFCSRTSRLWLTNRATNLRRKKIEIK